MKNNKKISVSVIITAAVFVMILFGIMFANILRTPDEVSYSERRTLAQMPEITMDSIISTDFMSDFEDYALDQFIMRDSFRSLKSNVHFNVFMQKDNHGIYLVGDTVSKLETLKNDSFIAGINKVIRLQQQYLTDIPTYFTLVPDKNYYIAAQNGYPCFDYDFIKEAASAVDATHIDLYGAMNIDDFYKTDLHWDQAKLQNVLNTLGASMGFEIDLSGYTTNTLSPFYGTYYGQSALNLAPDTLTYLTHESIDNAVVKILDDKTLTYVEIPMYDKELFNGIDPYNFFLQGPAPIITIENANAASSRELVIIRDSFGSSIAPLFTEAYSKITLVDLRYIASPLLAEYVDFNSNTEAIFMLSAGILNNSETLLVR